MKPILFILTLFISLNGVTQKSADEKAQDAISKYLKNKFKDETYKAYTFGDLFKITPPEIASLDSLKSAVDSLQVKGALNDSIIDIYDQLMKAQLKEIRSKKLYPVYEMEHYFTIKESFKQHTLYHSTFTLFPDGKVKDIDNHLTYELTDAEYDSYYNYYRRYDLFKTKELNKKEKETTYAYLEDLYSNEADDKTASFRTILATIGCIKKSNYYDSVCISQAQVFDYLTKRSNIEITEITYTNLEPIFLDSLTYKPSGYKIFAKAKYEKLLSFEEKAFYFEFDYDYIIRNVLPIEAPFEKYFAE